MLDAFPEVLPRRARALVGRVFEWLRRAVTRADHTAAVNELRLRPSLVTRLHRTAAEEGTLISRTVTAKSRAQVPVSCLPSGSIRSCPHCG